MRKRGRSRHLVADENRTQVGEHDHPADCHPKHMRRRDFHQICGERSCSNPAGKQRKRESPMDADSGDVSERGQPVFDDQRQAISPGDQLQAAGFATKAATG